jgi:hypothetical protein
MADVGLGKLGGAAGKKAEASSDSGIALREVLKKEERALSNRPNNKNAGNRPGRDARAQADVQNRRNEIANSSRNAEAAGAAVGSTVGSKTYGIVEDWLE